MKQNELEKALWEVNKMASSLGLKLSFRLVDWTPGTASDPYFQHVYYLDLAPEPAGLTRPVSHWALGWRAGYVDGAVDQGHGAVCVWEISQRGPMQPAPLRDEELQGWLEGWVRTVDAARRLAGELPGWIPVPP